jgi:hypothetical protein
MAEARLMESKNRVRQLNGGFHLRRELTHI